MNLAEPLLTVCPDSHRRVLAVLAVAADQPLSGGETARRAGMADTAALDALDRLAAGGVVGRIKASNVSHHGLYTDHVAANAVLALAALPAKLVKRVAAHVAAWEPPPATVALRLPCPARRDAQRRELIDLLVVAGDGQAGVRPWRQAAGGLAEQMWRWSGNRVHLHVHTPAQLADAGDGELHAAAWTLVAGARVASLPFAGAGAPRSA
jgi:hypothetical protein